MSCIASIGIGLAEMVGGAHPTGSAATTQVNGHGGGGHSDPFALVLLELAVVIVLAMVGRWAAGRVKQPAVLGELLLGVVLGNVGYAIGEPLFILVMHLGDAVPLITEVVRTGRSIPDAAQHVFTTAQMNEGGVGAQLVAVMTGPGGAKYLLMGFALWMFSNLGVILLLFVVGLESSVPEMLSVGGRSAAIAIVGVVAPFGLGFAAAHWLLPDAGTPAHLFLAATLCATSVGITARVFKDLGMIQSREAKVVLGAAVIDDVLGLIILAIAVGVAATGSLEWGQVGRIALLSALFLSAVIFLGGRLAGAGARLTARFDPSGNSLLFPLALCFFLSWAANRIELATIVGAFAAGLILEAKHFQDIDTKSDFENVIAPLERIFAPMFFVLMGMQVNLRSFAQPGTLVLAGTLTAVAVVSKLACGLVAGPAKNRWAVGMAMVPRGEVGLIFASVGKGMGVVTDAEFSGIVIMVIVTTLVTPPGLAFVMRKKGAVVSGQ